MAARKPRKTTARRTTATAKIRVHTDEYGRKVYSIVGTKKFAYTLAKAKEIASKSKAGKKRASTKKSTALTTTRKRKATTTKRRTTARRTTGAKRNAKGQFVKAKRTTRANARRSKEDIIAAARGMSSYAQRRKAQRPGAGGITIQQTRTVAANILRELGGEDDHMARRRAMRRDVTRSGVITGLTAETAYMEGGVDDSLLPVALRGKGYFDFDNAHRMFWTPR